MAVAAYGSLLSWAQSLDRIQQLHENGKIIVEKQQVLDLQNKVQIILQFLEALPHQALTSKMNTLTQEIKVLVFETELLIDAQVLEQLDGKTDGLLLFTRALNQVILKLKLLAFNLKDELVSYLKDKTKFAVKSLEAHSKTSIPQMEDFITEIIVIAVEIALMDTVLMDQIGENHHDLSSFGKGLIGVIHKLESFDRKLIAVDLNTEQSSDPSLKPIQRASSKLSSEKEKFVGLEENTTWIIRKLISHEKNLQIIPIVGMGGIGKTTLAQHVYEHSQIKLRFERRIWCTISQNYTERQILQSLLQDRSNEENRDLGLKLYHSLHSRRYLIILDDMWSIDPWEYLMKFLPDKMNYSRIIVTTRMSNIADSLSSRMQCIMKPLDDASSWSLLCDKIFNGQDCPNGFEKIGKSIAKSCWGLPISLVTIGGLLSKSDMTLEYWENVAENVKKIGSSGDCMKVLSLSYNYMPIHLKLCFLHFRFLPEDTSTDAVKMLRKLILDGFVKPIHGKSIEEIAEKYMNDLFDRNLIFLYNRSSTGELEGCGIHDLLRELCLSESDNEKFLLLPRDCYHSRGECYLCGVKKIIERIFISEVLPLKDKSYLEICQSCKMTYPVLGKSKFLNFSIPGLFKPFLHSTVTRRATISIVQNENLVLKFLCPLPVLYLWNLQVLEIYSGVKPVILPSEIWDMQQLRILIVLDAVLPLPGQYNDSITLEQLHTLRTNGLRKLRNVLTKRIPNLRKLHLSHFFKKDADTTLSPLSNLARFYELQSLQLNDMNEDELKSIIFPSSLKELIITGAVISEEEMIKIGSLPNLETLQLTIAKIVDEWSTVEGQFVKLKSLQLRGNGIKLMEVESDDFPNLERLSLIYVTEFEIPSSIGDNPCLRSIHLTYCDEVVIRSAVQIVEEQIDMGNTTLELYINYELFSGSSDDALKEDSDENE